MSAPNKPIRLSENEDALLRRLYVNFRIPRDQYKKRPEDLAALEKTWCDLSGRSDAGTELVRYIQNQQKAKRRLKVAWPVFDGMHERSPAISGTLSDEQMAALKIAYASTILPLGLGTDAAIWNDEVVIALASEFMRLTGRIIPGILLLAIAEEKRKRGLWAKVGRNRGSDLGFSDLGELDRAEDQE